VKRLYFLVLLIIASASVSANAAETPVILVFGDSISAGYGLPRVEQGWVELLRTRLNAQGYVYQVVNASVSGETTAGGLARLPRALDLHHPKIVIIELGGNDGLRGLPIPQMRTNVAQMADLATAAGAKIVLLGIRMPPNYGPEYTQQFFGVFSELARDKKAALVPFLLDGIVLDPTLVQADDIHPNAIAQPILLDNVWPALKPLLRK
jgi:acyl-CoA thioesterase I